MKKFLNQERIVALVCFIFGAWVFYSGTQMPVTKIDPVGPGAFPQLIGALAMIISVVHFIISKTNKDNPTEKETKDETEEKPKENYKEMGYLIVLIAAYIVLMPIVGFFIATIAFLMAFSMYFDKRSVKEKLLGNIIFSVAFTVFLYLIFAVALGVMLPTLFI